MTKEMLKRTAEAMWCEVAHRKRELERQYNLNVAETEEMRYVACGLGEGYVYESIKQTTSDLEKALEHTLKARRTLLSIEYDVEKRYKKR